MCDKTECKKAKPVTLIPPQPLSCAAVIGLTFDNGVILAADSLVSYEGLAMYTDAQRIFKVNESTLLGGGTNFADFQYLQQVIEDKTRAVQMSTLELKDFLRTGLYNRSIKANPLRIDLVLGGLQDGVPYLCLLDQRGFVCQDEVIATGFGAKMILPYLKHEVASRGNVVEEHEAVLLMQQGIDILYKRHVSAHKNFYVGIVDKSGSRLEKITLKD